MITTYINNFNDDWKDLKYTGGFHDIRTRGTYPNVKKDKHYHSHHHPNASPFLWNQHKPYGIATLNLLDPYDDRPDWFMFRSKPKKRYYEEVTPKDREDFHTAMEQDHDMHISHHHVHIKEIEKNNIKDEIADEIIL